jgi:hypothetical protein
MLARDKSIKIPKEKINMSTLLTANKAITAKTKLVIELLENNQNADKEIKKLFLLLGSVEDMIENSEF